jgi:hypothetical protein
MVIWFAARTCRLPSPSRSGKEPVDWQTAATRRAGSIAVAQSGTGLAHTRRWRTEGPSGNCSDRRFRATQGGSYWQFGIGVSADAELHTGNG